MDAQSSRLVATDGSRFPPRAALFLWIGAASGLLLALASLALPSISLAKPRLPPGVVAVVNGQPIKKGDYDVVLRTIAELQQRPATDSDRRIALDRVINDELMIEYGVELGLVRDDPTTRQALLSAAREIVLGRYKEPETEDAFAAKIAALRKAAQIRVTPVLP